MNKSGTPLTNNIGQIMTFGILGSVRYSTLTCHFDKQLREKKIYENFKLGVLVLIKMVINPFIT